MPYKLKTLQGYYDEVWTKGHLDAIPQYFAPDARTRGIMGEMPFDAGDLADLIFMIREQLGPLQISLPVSVEQNDWLSALVEVKSHALSSGDTIHVFGQMIVRFENEKMFEIHNSFDSLLFFEQLGLLPENAMAVMLSGTRLC